MAFQVSPGVQVKEIDATSVVPAVSTSIGGFAGSFFATRQAFISPESFTFIESAIIVAIVVLGGMGSQTADNLARPRGIAR